MGMKLKKKGKIHKTLEQETKGEEAMRDSKTNNTNETMFRLLTEREAAKFLSVSMSYLHNARCYGDREGGRPGPPFVKLNDAPKAAVRYSLRALIAWVEERKQSPRRFPTVENQVAIARHGKKVKRVRCD